MHETKPSALITESGFMDHIPRFTFDGGRYVREDDFRRAVRNVHLGNDGPAAANLARALLAVTGPQVIAGDALDSMAGSAEPDEASADSPDTARLDAFIDWYLRGGARKEIHEWGHAERTTREIILSALDGMVEQRSSQPGGQ